MPWNIPEIKNCCGCVKDLRTAAAIIAVLGIVTSPAVSWAAVRHSYVIRVSCFVTTSDSRPDVVDINLNNVLSFGFGANAGLGPSCLGPTPVKRATVDEIKSSPFVDAVKYIGWIVLLTDVIFLLCSIFFLYKLFNGPDIKASNYFMWSAAFSIILSFVYGMLYVTACVSIGGAFPIFEFAFCIIDVLVWSMWLYYIFVIYYYRRQRMSVVETAPTAEPYSDLPYRFLDSFSSWWDYFYQLLPYIGYCFDLGIHGAMVQSRKAVVLIIIMNQFYCCGPTF